MLFNSRLKTLLRPKEKYTNIRGTPLSVQLTNDLVRVMYKEYINACINIFLMSAQLMSPWQITRG